MNDAIREGMHTVLSVLTLVEMRPKSLHVTGMFLACNMQGFGTFSMHVCMLCACNMQGF